MGFFADYDEEKKKRNIDGGKTGTAASFFTDVGKNIVAGGQQGLGLLADIAIKGGSVLNQPAPWDNGEVANLRRMASSKASEDMLNWIYSQKDINGNSIGGSKKADESVQRLKEGKGDLKDVAQIAGTSLDVGLNATALINPVSAARSTAAATGAKLTATETAKDIGKVAATFGGGAGTSAGLNTYAETGDIGEAAKAAATGAVTGAIVPTALDIAGRGTGAALRNVINKTATDNQVIAKAEMQNGTKAAQQATDTTGKPVSQSQVINSAEPEVNNAPLSIKELEQVADRPVGQNPADYLKTKKSSEPTSMAAEVTPGRELSVDIPNSGGRMGTESGGVPSADAPVTQIVAKPMKVQDAPQPSALNEPAIQPEKLNELNPEVQKLVNEQVSLSEKSAKPSFNDKYSKGFFNRSTEDLGKLGADTSSSMIKGAKLKSDITNDLRPVMKNIDNGVKKVAGKSDIAQARFMTKVDKALQDRSTADTAFKTPEELAVYKDIERVYDYIMQERIARGLPVRKDYSPTQMIRAGGEDPSYLASSLNSKITTADSRFSKARNSENGAEQAVFNVKDLYNYVNSQSTEFAYKEASDIFREGIKNIPPEIANSKKFQNGIRALADAYSKAVNPTASSKVDSTIRFFQSTVYKNILWNNPKNAAFSAAQTLIARGDVTQTAKAIAKTFDKDTLKEISNQKWFGDATVSADTVEGSRLSFLGKATEKASKLDINRSGEEYAVKTPFKLGFAQGISETKAYKNAIKAGKSQGEAAKEAMKDPVAYEYAVRSGNVLVNNTAFGANSMARPEFLRDASAVKRAFTMFMRFPLGMTQLIKDSMNPAQARAIDILMKGDPRATPVPEMRQKYQQTLGALNKIEKAAKNGELGDVKLEAIQNSIKLTKENIKVVDDTIKELSSIRGSKRAAALVKMWAATAAIQFLWTGLTDPENASPLEAIKGSDPTVLSKINPLDKYSVGRGGLSTPLLPGNQYGINWNGAANLIPGAGIVNRAVKIGTGNSAVDWLRGKTN